MPYISVDQRNYSGSNPDCAGHMNYLFTEIVSEYLKRGLNYQRINDCIGALEGAKLELYRRVAVPYEDVKIKENGDVYDAAIVQ